MTCSGSTSATSIFAKFPTRRRCRSKRCNCSNRRNSGGSISCSRPTGGGRRVPSNRHRLARLIWLRTLARVPEALQPRRKDQARHDAEARASSRVAPNPGSKAQSPFHGHHGRGAALSAPASSRGESALRACHRSAGAVRRCGGGAAPAPNNEDLSTLPNLISMSEERGKGGTERRTATRAKTGLLRSGSPPIEINDCHQR